MRRYRVTGELLSDEKLQSESPFVLRQFAVTGAEATIIVLSRH
jgi:hypothetical protein